MSKAQQTRVWLLSIVIVDKFHCLNNGAKTHVFDVLDFQGQRLFQRGTSVYKKVATKIESLSFFHGHFENYKNDIGLHVFILESRSDL